jgi:ABC-type transporter Mla subunit MlaD
VLKKCKRPNVSDVLEGLKVQMTRVEGSVARVIKHLQSLSRQGAKMGEEFDAAVARMTEKLETLTSASDSVAFTVRTLVAQVRELAGQDATPAQLNAWADTIEAKVKVITDATLEGTSASE